MTKKSLTVSFVLNAETKGAIKYSEIDENGNVVDIQNSAIGTLYLRKSKLDGVVPQKVSLEVMIES